MPSTGTNSTPLFQFFLSQKSYMDFTIVSAYFLPFCSMYPFVYALIIGATIYYSYQSLFSKNFMQRVLKTDNLRFSSQVVAAFSLGLINAFCPSLIFFYIAMIDITKNIDYSTTILYLSTLLLTLIKCCQHPVIQLLLESVFFVSNMQCFHDLYVTPADKKRSTTPSNTPSRTVPFADDWETVGSANIPTSSIASNRDNNKGC